MEAEDAAQEVFVRILAALPTYEPRGATFRVWLFRIARNHVIDRQRTRAAERFALEAAELELGVEAPDRTDVLAIGRLGDMEFASLLAPLSKRQREVIVLRFQAGLALREIAAVLETSVSAVRNLQLRAFEILRPRLAHRRPEPSLRTATRQSYRRVREQLSAVLRSRRYALAA